MMILADAVAAAPGVLQGTSLADVWYGLAVALSSVVVLLIRTGGKALNAWLEAKAAESKNSGAITLAIGAAQLAEKAAETGAVAAWETYTKAIKAATMVPGGTNGKITAEQASEARSRALAAAKASLGESGLALLRSALGGSGWTPASGTPDPVDAALGPHIEAAYTKVP